MYEENEQKRRIYNNRDLTKDGGGGGKEGGSWMTERVWRIPVLGQMVPSPWDVGPSDSVCFSSPKQAVVSSKPNFWTHYLQIHCNGLGTKSVTLQ